MRKDISTILAFFGLLALAIGGCSLAASDAESVTSNSDWTPVMETFDGVEMVQVPAGCFMMGSEDGNSNEEPVHEVCFKEPFWIAMYEVTNREYALFLNAEGNQEEGGETWLNTESVFKDDVRIHTTGEQWKADSPYEDHPVHYVTWFGADSYCEWRNMRLPTEAEWAYAARGPDGLTYPWGNELIDENLVYRPTSGGESAAVGSRPDGVSWVGAHDMSGSVAEWVSSLFRAFPYDATDGREADSREGGRLARAVRSGGWNHDATEQRLLDRSSHSPYKSFDSFGFRCALSD